MSGGNKAVDGEEWPQAVCWLPFCGLDGWQLSLRVEEATGEAYCSVRGTCNC